MSFSWPVFPGLDQVLFPPSFSWFLGFDSKTVQRSALCTSRRELSNSSFLNTYYLLAKFGFDTSENEPCKVCPIERCPKQSIQQTERAPDEAVEVDRRRLIDFVGTRVVLRRVEVEGVQELQRAGFRQRCFVEPRRRTSSVFMKY